MEAFIQNWAGTRSDLYDILRAIEMPYGMMPAGFVAPWDVKYPEIVDHDDDEDSIDSRT
jgi:hypothetical protein